MLHTKGLKEGELFFRQWLRSPKSVGSILPSSRALCRTIASEVRWHPGAYVVELGGGTGVITKALIERGVPPERLVVVELDDALFAYLRQQFPKSPVVQGDAARLGEILAGLGIDRVSAVVSGLPMLNMPESFQRRVVEESFRAMGEDGIMLQYTYLPRCPIPADKFGLEAELVGFVWRNLPPATVWRLRRKG